MELSRKQKHPDPEKRVGWGVPIERKSPSQEEFVETDAASVDDFRKAGAGSNELKIQKLRQNKKDEVLYLLTSEIPDDPDHVATPISGNARMPVQIPWEDEHVSDVIESNEDFYDIPSSDSSMLQGYSEPCIDNSYEEDEPSLSEVLELLPQSVLVPCIAVVTLLNI